MALNLVAKKSGKTLDLTTLVKKGGTWHVEAVAGEQYQLIDTETGKTPEGIKVARVDDNLVIKSADDKYEVILEEFWTNCSEDDNQLCYAVFDVPATDSAQAGQVIITQVGEDVSTFKAGMVGTLPASGGFPLWAYIAGGALGLGAIAAAAGGGGGSDGGNNPAPQPKNTLLIDNNAGDGNTDGTVINHEEANSGAVEGIVNASVSANTTASLYDKNGNKVTVNGLPVEVPVNTNDGSFNIPTNGLKDGEYTVKVITKEKNNTTGQVSETLIDESPLTIDTTAPEAPKLTGESSDNKLLGGEKSAITGTAEDAKGGVATLVHPDGLPVTNAEGIVTVPIDANGNFTFNNIPDGNYAVKVTDKAGNPSEQNTPIVLDHSVPGDTNGDGKADTAPRITFVDDNSIPSNTLTRNEIGSDNAVAVAFDLPKNTQVGDTLVVTANTLSKPITHQITAQDLQDNKVTLQIPVDKTQAYSTLEVSAKVQDANGQESLATAPQSIQVDRTIQGHVAIVYLEDKNPEDHVLRADEIQQGTANSTPVRIYLPKGIAGNVHEDTVDLTIDGKTYKVSGDTLINTADNSDVLNIVREGSGNNELTYVTVNVNTAGKTSIDTNVELSFIKNGQQEHQTAQDSIRIDTQSPSGLPQLTIPKAADGYINADEAKGNITAEVKLPQGVEPGDHIIIKDDKDNTLADYTIPADATTASGETVYVPIAADKLPKNGDVKVTATIQEQDSDVAVTSNAVSFKVDTVIPGGADSPNDPDIYGEKAPVVSFPQDKNAPLNFLNGSEIGSADQAQAKVTLPEGSQVGDKVYYLVKDTQGNVISKGDVGIEATDISNNYRNISLNIPKDGTYTVETYVQDVAGNRSESSAPLEITIDTTAPTVKLSLDDNATALTVQSEPNTQLDITLPGGTHIKGTTDSNGMFKTPVNDLKPGADISVTATDYAGNSNHQNIRLDDNEAPTATPSLNSNGSVDLTVNDNSGTVLQDDDTYNNGSTVNVSFDGNNELMKSVELTDDSSNSTIKDVYNPRLDWLMNTADDNSGNDHAPGWQADNGSGYTWTGAAHDDVIIASPTANTEQDAAHSGQAQYQGMFGAIDGATFTMDSGAGNDYLQSKGIGGNITIDTKDGKDQINTGFMTGKDAFAGNQVIDMGNDDDILNVTGASNGVSLDGTNATIDMGDGFDVVNLAKGVTAGTTGNVIDLGEKDDKLTIGGSLATPNTTGKNIIDLGSGSDQLTVKGDISGRNAIFSTDSSRIDISGNIIGQNAMQLGNQDDNVRIRGSLTKTGDVSVAFSQGDADVTSGNINLGNGTNTLRVDGKVDGFNITGGDGKDAIQIGFDESKPYDINSEVTVNQTTVNTGGDDDNVLFSNMGSGVRVDAGTGNDVIETHKITGTHNEFHAGEGDDIIYLFGQIHSDATNIIDGGAGKDVVVIGTAGDGAQDKFIIGATESGYTTLQHVEVIQFNAAYGKNDQGQYQFYQGSGDTVKVADGNLGDGKMSLFIRGSDEMNRGGAAALSQNKVDLNGGWKESNTVIQDGITYREYHSVNSDDTLFIQTNISII